MPDTYATAAAARAAQEEAPAARVAPPQLLDAIAALDARAREAAAEVGVAKAYLAHCYETEQYDAVAAAHGSLLACQHRAAEAAAALVTVEKFR